MPKWGYGPSRSPLTRSHLGFLLDNSTDGPACTKHARAFGIPGPAVERFAKDICHLMWPEALRRATGPDQVSRLRREVEMSNKRPSECQLSAMKQITVLRTQNGNRELAKQEESAEDSDVTFHEPLEYLDGDTRNLVLRIVGDKIWQMKSGNMPRPSGGKP